MTTEFFESIWDGLEDTPTEAQNMKLRSSLIIAITEAVSAWHLTQIEAAKRLGVTQPRLAEPQAHRAVGAGVEAGLGAEHRQHRRADIHRARTPRLRGGRLSADRIEFFGIQAAMSLKAR